MRRRPTRAVLALALLVATSAGCIGRTIPILPPGISGADVAPITCTGEGCPTDGVTVHLHGSAQAGAIVVAVNTSRAFADGRPYEASAIAAVGSMVSDAGLETPPGEYDLWLEPEPDPAGGTVVSRHGDTIQVFQLVRQPDNTFEQSMSATITVP